MIHVGHHRVGLHQLPASTHSEAGQAARDGADGRGVISDAQQSSPLPPPRVLSDARSEINHDDEQVTITPEQEATCA
jgi:hypothetical protein